MFEKNVLLSGLTSFQIGGLAQYYFLARKEEDLIKAFKKVKEFKIPFYLLGKGSNVLFSDNGFKGLIIQIKSEGVEVKEEKIIAQAGTSLSYLARVAKENSLTGLEWAQSIPGTIGGAVYVNAAAFSFSMEDIVEKVKVLDTKDFKTKEIKDLKFAPKKSLFQKDKSLIILSVYLKLKKEKKSLIEKKEKEYSLYRQKTQPLNYPSAGCVFKNPENESAGALIERAGLKGKVIGGAMISKKHANFIINFQKAKAQDVKDLIKLIQDKVKEKFNIELEREIEFF